MGVAGVSEFFYYESKFKIKKNWGRGVQGGRRGGEWVKD